MPRSANASATDAQRIVALITALEELEDGRAAASARALVQAVLEMHGNGLGRLMEILEAHGEAGRSVLDAIAADEAVASLLLLHDLHPSELAARADRAIAKLRPSLGAHAISIDLVAAEVRSVRVKLQSRPKAHRPSPATLREEIETTLLEYVPEAQAIEIEGLPDPAVQELRFVPRKSGPVPPVIETASDRA